jgi:hypothetical protein
VTHPFHPLYGRSFELLTCRQTWGEYRVFFYDGGQLRAMPANWTDVVSPPVFVTWAAGRAHFRPEDLLSLAALVDGMTRPGRGTSVATGETPRPLPKVSSKLRRSRKAKDAAAPIPVPRARKRKRRQSPHARGLDPTNAQKTEGPRHKRS